MTLREEVIGLVREQRDGLCSDERLADAAIAIVVDRVRAMKYDLGPAHDAETESHDYALDKVIRALADQAKGEG